MRLNTRQKMIGSRLLSSDSPITLKQLSEELAVSSRTVQRELKSVKDMLQMFELDLDAKSGVGLRVIGEADKRRAAEQYISSANSEHLLTQEERHYRLKKYLLSLNEPVKLFYLASQLGVSEATISNDLARLERWFKRHHLQLIRKPGFGIFIEGEERRLRQAILELLYEQYSKDQLVYVLQKREPEDNDAIDQQLSIWNDLFHFIEEKHVRIIESILLDLRRKHEFYMSDSAFVGMVVHVALAVQRLKAGEGIEIEEHILAELKPCNEFQWAKEVAGRLSAALQVNIPESEIGYITMHLLGSHAGRNQSMKPYPTDEFARDMIFIAGNSLNVSLVEDQDLLSHLTQHLVSALYRISMNMKIRNPLLSEVRTNYPAEYAAASEAVNYLKKRTGLIIPDEETGYLAMHFGAAVLRKERAVSSRYKVIVVCTSGIGTSRLLAARIKKELPNLEVVAVVPLLDMEEFDGWESIDCVITTMAVDIDHTPVVEVSPFLTREDCLKIESRLAAIRSKPSEAHTESISVEQMIRKMNTYGEAVSDILTHFQLIRGLACKNKEEVIREAAYGALLQDPDADVETIMADLLYREKMGVWLAQHVGLSLIHYRTKGIHKPVVSVYRLSEPVEWQQGETVQSVLVLLVPDRAPQEYLDMIGGISEAMIDEEQLRRFVHGSEEETREHIHRILSAAYTAKAKQLIGAST